MAEQPSQEELAESDVTEIKEEAEERQTFRRKELLELSPCLVLCWGDPREINAEELDVKLMQAFWNIPSKHL